MPPVRISSPGLSSDVYYVHFFDKHLLKHTEVKLKQMIQQTQMQYIKISMHF